MSYYVDHMYLLPVLAYICKTVQCTYKCLFLIRKKFSALELYFLTFLTVHQRYILRVLIPIGTE